MTWSSPQFFWLLAVTMGVAAAVWFFDRRGARRLEDFAKGRLLDFAVTDRRQTQLRVRYGLRLAAVLATVVALAGPRWGFEWDEVKRRGIDLVIAVDTSKSMMATDVKPNRLERAKLAVLDLTERLHGDRVALVPFAGTAFLECPLTLDYGAFERSLRTLQPGIIPYGGTAIATAIRTALKAFDGREAEHQALILITDGEDHEGQAVEAAAEAKSRGIKIFSVGIGTPEGELIPGSDGDAMGFLKNRQGEVIKSRLDEQTLREVALESNGAYVRGLGPALGLDQVFDEHIAKLEKREVASTMHKRYEERFQIPLAIALACLLLELLLRPTRARETNV